MTAGRSELYCRRRQQFIDEVTIYPVSCERLSDGRGDMYWLDEVLRGGARVVQLRDKESSDRRLLEKAKYFRRKTLEIGALFLVNDRVDIALLAGADGVHVGQQDLPPEEIAKLGPDLLVGVSCNNEEQAGLLAEAEKSGAPGASYYNIGPIYSTQTKDGLVTFIGPEAISRFSANLSMPFTIMGGIKREHVPELLSAGARRIAVVTALTKAQDIADETRSWIQAIQEARRAHDE